MMLLWQQQCEHCQNQCITPHCTYHTHHQRLRQRGCLLLQHPNLLRERKQHALLLQDCPLLLVGLLQLPATSLPCCARVDSKL